MQQRCSVDGARSTSPACALGRGCSAVDGARCPAASGHASGGIRPVGGSGFVGQRQPPDRSSSAEWRRAKGWNSPSWWGLQLSIALVAQPNAQGVLSVCSNRVSQLHLVNAATALHRVAKAPDAYLAVERPGLKAIISRIHQLLKDDKVPKFTVSLANIMWACAKMGYSDIPLLNVICMETLRHLASLDCQECSNTTWALAALELVHDELLSDLRSKSMDLISGFTMQDLANTGWAYAKLGILDTPYMDAISREARRKFWSGIPQNLSNLAWAFSTLPLSNLPLFHPIANAVVGGHLQFEVQDLSNTAWAFATSEARDEPLLEAVARQVAIQCSTSAAALQHKSRMELLERAFALVSFAWAFAFLASWPGGLAPKHLAAALCKLGRELDLRGEGSAPPARPGSDRLALLEGRTQRARPRLIVDRPGVAVVLKPAGWEVDGLHADAGDQGLLSTFLKATFPVEKFPLPHCANFQYGFIHRLDVPSSGLILVGTSFEGLYSLRLQLNTFAMQREYVVMCHHLMHSSLRECWARIDMLAKRSMEGMWGIGGCSVSEHGKPAMTCLASSAQFSWKRVEGHQTHSLVCIRIRTGRNHQIRTHLLHCFHPTVVDGKYTCQAVQVTADPADAPRLRGLREALSQPVPTASTASTAALAEQPGSAQPPRRLPRLRRLPPSTSGIELRC